MKEISDEIEKLISKPKLENEKYRDRLYNLIQWLRYWSNQDISCRKG